MRNLSDEIIFGTPAGVLEILSSDPSTLNEYDQYGYTPLIETIICRKPELTRLLIDRGADLDQEDMLGQTALYWAANHYHPDICAWLLEKGANPNRYTAEGQPILVMPMLRKQTDLIALLAQYGGNTLFPQDFIEAKLIGHRYELVGQVDIVNAEQKFVEIDFEGFLLEFTIGVIRQSLLDFMERVASVHYPNYNHILNRITTTFRIASELISFEYAQNVDKYTDSIREKTQNNLFIAPTAYEGHAITFVRYRNLFAKCDRGVNQITDTVIIYEMERPQFFDLAFIKKLLYQKGKSKYFIQTEIKELLGLKPLATLPTRYQLAGNCSWANVEACVPTLMFMLLAQGGIWDKYQVPEYKRLAMDFYNNWVEWGKDETLDDCLSSFHEADRVRKAAKLDILGAIFAQRCNPKNPRELRRARKILPLLLTPEYQYILDSYLKVYTHRNAGQVGDRFVKLLEACGVSL